MLHTLGAYYIWVSFLTAFLRRALRVAPGYWVGVALLVCLAGLRLLAAVRRRSGAAVRA